LEQTVSGEGVGGDGLRGIGIGGIGYPCVEGERADVVGVGAGGEIEVVAVLIEDGGANNEVSALVGVVDQVVDGEAGGVAV